MCVKTACPVQPTEWRRGRLQQQRGTVAGQHPECTVPPAGAQLPTGTHLQITLAYYCFFFLYRGFLIDILYMQFSQFLRMVTWTVKICKETSFGKPCLYLCVCVCV